MKKEEVVEGLEKTGYTINDLYARAWATALHPTTHGWANSIASAGMIPVLSLASVGQMVTAAVAEQVPADVYDKVSNFGKPSKP